MSERGVEVAIVLSEGNDGREVSLQQTVQLRKRISVSPPRDLLDHGRFQYLAEFQNILRVRHGDRPDAMPPPRLDLDKPFKLELLQSIAHWRLRDLIAPSQLRLAQFLARRQGASKNVLSDELEDPVALEHGLCTIP